MYLRSSNISNRRDGVGRDGHLDGAGLFLALRSAGRRRRAEERTGQHFAETGKLIKHQLFKFQVHVGFTQPRARIKGKDYSGMDCSAKV